MKSNKAQWITRTAIMIALLVVLQAVTKSLGQFVTGSCVNFILAASTLLIGVQSACVVAILSPFFAFMFGIGPVFIGLVPCVSAGNLALVLMLWLIAKGDCKLGKSLAAVACAAAVKFIVLYSLIVKIALPLLPLNEKQIAVMSASFSWPQLVTAAIGGSLAAMLAPRLKKALK